MKKLLLAIAVVVIILIIIVVISHSVDMNNLLMDFHD